MASKKQEQSEPITSQATRSLRLLGRRYAAPVLSTLAFGESMGSVNAIIASSAKISKGEFIEFFESKKCEWYSGHKDQAIIFDDHTQVGVCLMKDDYIEMFTDEELAEFRKALKSDPKTFFEINRTKDDDPNQLYFNVAKMMSKLWPIALQDIYENILTIDEIEIILSNKPDC